MKLLVKIPTKWRGLGWLDIWLERSKLCDFLISVDSDEYTEAQVPKMHRVFFELGESQNKIHAINRDIEKYIHDYDVLAVFGDDFEPTENFDLEILNHFEKAKDLIFYDTNFCLWFNDGYTQDRLCTYPIMGKEYFNSFGYVYNPEYRSVYADNEQGEVAKLLHKVLYINQVVCKHRHYVNDRLVQKDELYAKNEKLEAGDKETYERRKANNFYIAPLFELKTVVL
jgi:hypothetical protein